MKVKLSSVLVDDQAKALAFYVDVLGFTKKTDIPMAKDRWLTVVSPEAPDEVELLLEPNHLPAAQAYQRALYDQSIPLTAFEVSDINAEYDRLRELGVKFRSKPTRTGPVTVAIFEDTCGNLIQIYET